MRDQSRPHVDGRCERRNRSRERLLRATQSLMLDGNWRPDARRIARLARVSTRTLFGIFDGLPTLYAAAIEDPAIAAAIATRVLSIASTRQPALIQRAVAYATVTGRPYEAQP